MARKQRSKTLKGGLCPESILFITPSLIVSGLLIWHGIKYIPLFPPQTGDQLGRFSCIFAPWIIAALILVIVIITLISNVIIEITITPESFTYKRGRMEFISRWQDLVFRPPNPRQKLFRYFIISNGRTVARIHSAYFPKFELLMELIPFAKDSFKSGDYHV